MINDAPNGVMEKMLNASCPCGFNFQTPAGEVDAVATLQDHVHRNHKDKYPEGLSNLRKNK